MLTIGEAAKEAGVDPQTIRFYEKIGLLPKPARSENRYRQYGKADLNRIEFIKKAKALGLGLKEVGHILDIKDHGQRPCAEVRKILNEKLTEVRKQVRLLHAFQKELQEYLEGLPERGITGEICGCIETHRIFLRNPDTDKV